jgi:hypothetical protein
MRIGLGDKVRFLNEVGGGTVSRIEGDKLAYVLDEDGFEVPALLTEIVLVEKMLKSQQDDIQEEVDEDYEFDESDDEGEPKVLLACLRSNELAGNILLHLVNDSNFFVLYTIGKIQEDQVENAYFGTIEPNTKIKLDSLPINKLDGVVYAVQILLFRKSKSYSHQLPVSFDYKFNGTKLLKDTSYTKSGYFEDKAFVIYVLKGKFESKLDELSDKEMKKVVREKEKVVNKVKPKRRDDEGMLEVDLHINELLDDTRGLSNKEILGFQMEKFHQVMIENKNKKNRKIVFIHGVGNGVLKNEIRKALDKKYKWNSYQDASFKEYGYGATMVTV